MNHNLKRGGNCFFCLTVTTSTERSIISLFPTSKKAPDDTS